MPKSETMTKIRISNDQNEFFRVVCFEFGTFEIWICFEFRASIFEFPSLEIQTAKEPLSPAPQFMGHDQLYIGGLGGDLWHYKFLAGEPDA